MFVTTIWQRQPLTIRDVAVVREELMSSFRNAVLPDTQDLMLFRMDRESLTVQSQEIPTWGDGVFGESDVNVIALRSAFGIGDAHLFRLRVNAGDACGDKVSASWLDWLQRRAEVCGFTLVPGTITWSKSAEHWSVGAWDFKTIDFEGRLWVADPLRFYQTIIGGVGAGRRYGCGLLWLENVHGARSSSSICPFRITDHAISRYRQLRNPHLTHHAAKAQLSELAGRAVENAMNGGAQPKALTTGATQYRVRGRVPVRLLVKYRGGEKPDLVTVLPCHDGKFDEPKPNEQKS